MTTAIGEREGCELASIALPDPAPGTGFLYTVPGTIETRVLSVSFQLANAAAAASRVPVLSFVDSSGVPFAQVGAPFATLTGTTSRFTFAVGLQEFGAADGPNIGAPIPDMRLYVGLAVALAVTAMNAADAISDVRLYVEQFNVRD